MEEQSKEHVGTLQTNSVALSPQANYTDRSVAAGRPTANFFGYRSVEWSAGWVPTAVNLYSRPEQLRFHARSSSIILMRLSGPRSKKIWYCRGSNPGLLGL
jgi:hypothetical protein